MESPGLRYLLFAVNLLRTSRGSTSTVRPSRPDDQTYHDMVRVIQENADETAIPRADGAFSGTLAFEFADRDVTVTAVIHEDRTEITLH
jgi:hypothetical protein